MTDVDAGTARQVLQLFDEKAASWSAKYAEGGRLTGRLAVLAHEIEARSEPGWSVLDLGCGSGELARQLAASGRQVTGCDISAEMLGRAAEADPAGSVRLTRLQPGWTALPFSARAFDVVVASSVLEYVDEPSAVLRECSRVLRPGGVAVLTVPDLRHPIRWLEWLARGLARVSPITAVARREPRLGAYLSYLRLSHQRHTQRWWNAAAVGSDLRPIALSPRAAASPLLLLILQRAELSGQM